MLSKSAVSATTVVIFLICSSWLRFVSVLKHVGIEKGKVIVRLRFSRHVPARQSSHRIRVIFMLDAHAFSERRVVEHGHVSRGIDVSVLRPQELVDNDSIFRRKANRLS